jgi:hypothetical protein
VSVSGGSTTVNLDGIEITGGSAGEDGIYCQNGSVGPSLRVRRSFIHDVVGGAGINASKCKVTLERNQIGPGNAGGGIALSAVQYSIANNFVVGNGNVGPGVSFSGACSELSGGFGFKHNTVAKNLTLAGVSGISCNASSMTPIVNSIVWSNGSSDTGGGTGCMLTSTNTSMAPDFVDSSNPATYDFHLNGKTTANNACCIDKISTSTVTNDYDGRSRPQGASWDIGAHEVP